MSYYIFKKSQSLMPESPYLLFFLQTGNATTSLPDERERHSENNLNSEVDTTDSGILNLKQYLF